MCFEDSGLRLIGYERKYSIGTLSDHPDDGPGYFLSFNVDDRFLTYNSYDYNGNIFRINTFSDYGER